MSVQQIIFALLFPILVLPATSWWGIQGFVAGQAMVVLLVCAYLIRRDPPRRVGWNWPQLHGLIRVGGPIMLAGLLYSLLTTVDRWVIVNRLGVEALGHYSLAILCVGTLSLFPAIIAQQMYPRMAFRFGQTGNPKTLTRLVRNQALLTIIATTPLLVVAAILMPWFVTRWMPAYLPGVGSAQIVLLGLIAIATSSGAGNFLNTVGLSKVYLGVQTTTILVSLGLSLIFVNMGLGLNGVALGAACANLFFAIALWIVYILVLQK